MGDATFTPGKGCPLAFAPQAYPGGRIILMLGQHEAGAVFPPWGDDQHRYPWAWRFWLGAHGNMGLTGRAKTDQAARNALMAAATDWLRRGGLVE